MTKNGAFAGQALGEQSALLLLRGKAGRSEAPPGAIADAVNALMEAVHFPAAATINSQVNKHFTLKSHISEIRLTTATQHCMYWGCLAS